MCAVRCGERMIACRYGIRINGCNRTVGVAETKQAESLKTLGFLPQRDVTVLPQEVAQRQREIILAQCRAGNFQLFVATDVAARGQDISEVQVMVRYCVPRDFEPLNSDIQIDCFEVDRESGAYSHGLLTDSCE